MANISEDDNFQHFLESVAVVDPSPFVRIIEQPRSRGLRFRYECEGPRAGSLLGANSTSDTRTCPKIQIMNYTGLAVIVVSCVTKEQPHRPHPHSLVGKDCKDGVCTVKVDDFSSENMQVKFPQLGIQCAKKKDIADALHLRESVRVDPFDTGFQHQSGSLDLTVVCLCFQVFLWDSNIQMYSKVLTPVVSEPIYDKKALSELVICRIDRHSAPCCGGQEMFLLCDKITKDDIEIRFFEETEDGQLIWEGFGDFSPSDVHKQVAIVFKIPSYRLQTISGPVSVMVQLRRPSDRETSDPKPFQYLSMDLDPDGIERKRKKGLNTSVFNYIEDLGFKSSSAPQCPTLPTINIFQNRTIRQPLHKIIKTESATQDTCTLSSASSTFSSPTSHTFSSPTSHTFSSPSPHNFSSPLSNAFSSSVSNAFSSSDSNLFSFGTSSMQQTTNKSVFTTGSAATNISSGDYFFQSTFLQNPRVFMPDTLPQEEVGGNESNNQENLTLEQSYSSHNTDFTPNSNELETVLDNMVAQHFQGDILEASLMDINVTDMERLDDLLAIIELDNLQSNT